MDRMLRLDKFLADMGVGTRSAVRTLIRKGMVYVNEVQVKSPDYKVSLKDSVVCMGRTVSYSVYEYIMLYKPSGVVSATEDSRDKTVLDLIKNRRKKDLFPVGRLDKDTEGLLLLTNDGALAHSLLSPRHHISKVYYAKVCGKVMDSDVTAFKDGLEVDSSFTALPANLTVLSASDTTSEIELEIFEGKFHQVKRMFKAVGKEVTYLKRLSMGAVKLDGTLTPGEYRSLTESEIRQLKMLQAKEGE